MSINSLWSVYVITKCVMHCVKKAGICGAKWDKILAYCTACTIFLCRDAPSWTVLFVIQQ